MVLEHAVINIKLGVSREFEEAVAEGKAVVAESEGFVSLTLHRGIEFPDQYLLSIQWRTLEDHTVGFRQSERFNRWRAIVGPYFESSPEVFHLAPVEGLA
ncbi:MAG TPA: antibiotic biosynthesis monooxygenase family protein [Acidimicrobiales bacterium]|jgi:heme-degrading monooxygenase HmoA|nr:antibiotic biosynthesis monooxygenase family protein [Acidimicrobiales bacterium]